MCAHIWKILLDVHFKSLNCRLTELLYASMQRNKMGGGVFLVSAYVLTKVEAGKDREVLTEVKTIKGVIDDEW